MRKIPKSEPPTRRHRATSGAEVYRGEDARNKVTHDENGITRNSFLEQQEPRHIGDGLNHSGGKATSAPIMPKTELPTSNQEAAELHLNRKSGGPEKEHHRKSWAGNKGGSGVQHLDPPAMKFAHRVSSGSARAAQAVSKPSI